MKDLRGRLPMANSGGKSQLERIGYGHFAWCVRLAGTSTKLDLKSTVSQAASRLELPVLQEATSTKDSAFQFLSASLAPEVLGNRDYAYAAYIFNYSIYLAVSQVDARGILATLAGIAAAENLQDLIWVAYEKGDDWFVQLTGGETLDRLARAVGDAYSGFFVRALRFASSSRGISKSTSDMDRKLREMNMDSAKREAQGIFPIARKQCTNRADKLATLDQFAKMMDL
jgi:hypothetical protein